MDARDQENTEAPQMRLVDVEITNENMALNLMVSFLNLANKRGAFTLDESAKIWECVSRFSDRESTRSPGKATGDH